MELHVHESVPHSESQFERVDKLFKRQLAVPLIGQYIVAMVCFNTYIVSEAPSISPSLSLHLSFPSLSSSLSPSLSLSLLFSPPPSPSPSPSPSPPYPLPLSLFPGMQDTLTQYRQFSENTVTEDDLPAYDRALKRLESMLPFEENLVNLVT